MASYWTVVCREVYRWGQNSERRLEANSMWWNKLMLEEEPWANNAAHMKKKNDDDDVIAPFFKRVKTDEWRSEKSIPVIDKKLRSKRYVVRI